MPLAGPLQDDWIGVIRITSPELRHLLDMCAKDVFQLVGIRLMEDGHLLDRFGVPVHGRKHLSIVAPTGLLASDCGRCTALRDYALSSRSDLKIIRKSIYSILETNPGEKE